MDRIRLVQYAVCMLLVALHPAKALCMDGVSESWAITDSDRRGALPNDASVPEFRALPFLLAPLPQEEEGTIRRVDTGEEKVAAFTFDMCELATKTTGCDMEILNYLRQEGVPATLFMGGKWMRTHSARVRQIMKEPLFEIGSHAWSHGNFGIMSEEAMREQIEWTQAEYARLREETLRHAEEHEQPAPEIAPVPTLFRLPYGRCNDRALAVLAGYGLRVIQWDVAAELGRDNASPSVAKAAVRLIKPGSIVLMHANLVPKGTAALVRFLVQELRGQGYRFVTVGKLLGMGTPVRVRDGYFTTPGDNLSLDTRFGYDGTGRRRAGR